MDESTSPRRRRRRSRPSWEQRSSPLQDWIREYAPTMVPNSDFARANQAAHDRFVRALSMPGVSVRIVPGDPED